MRSNKNVNEDDIQSLYKLIIDQIQHEPMLFIWNQQGQLIEPQPPSSLNNITYTIYYNELFTSHIIEQLQEHQAKFHQSFTIKNSRCFSFTPEHFNSTFSQVLLEGRTYTIVSVAPIHIQENYNNIENIHAQLMTGQLAAGYVHEIRNPLTSIKGFIQLLQAGISQEEQYYKVMIAEIEKIEQLTTQLLEVAKPVHKKITSSECIESMIEDVLFLFKTNTRMKDIYFYLQLEDSCVIECNRMQVKQAFMNLIKNSIEAMKYKGIVSIFGKKINTYYHVMIQDNGPGIPKQVLEQIGTPFVSTKQQGTGLGLMISKQLIEENHGEMIVQTNHSTGCSIEIVFPIFENNNEMFM